MSHWLLSIFIFLSWPLASQEMKYTMADLQALEAQKSYEEFFKHARDIRPSQRDQQWREMLGDMALGLIDFQLERHNFKQSALEAIEELATWPVLQSDEFFLTKRRRYFSKYIKSCVTTPSRLKSCEKDIRRYWANSQKNIDLGIQLAEHIEKYKLSLNSWDYLERAPLAELSKFHCKKDILQTHLVRKLSAAFKQKGEIRDISSHISLHLNNDCWEQLAPTLKKHLFSRSTKQVTKDIFYQLLKARNEMNKDEEDLFLTLYVLEGPIVGETFNRAWNRITSLSEDYKRREKMLSKLKGIDPLPGSLFSSPNKTRRDTILKHFHKNIPEYFPFYAKTCLDYMNGRGEFPNGNPTLQCSDFFEVTKNKDWVSQKLNIQFSGLKK